MGSLMEFFRRKKEPLKRGEREAQSLKRRRQKDLVIRGASAAAVAVVVILSVYLWQSGLVSDALHSTGERMEERLTDAGLVVGEIRIDGQKQAALDDIRQALDVSHGENIMALDLKGMRERVEALDWVKSASIGRSMPDILTVRIEEYEPAAIWQVDGRLWLVTRDGQRITDQKLGLFPALPMVVGEGAEQALPDYLELTMAWPDIFAGVESAVRVGERRWDLLMKQGITVRLPEKNVSQALEKFAGLARDEKILDKDILAVDLRLEDKTFIRLTPEEAKRRRLAAENTEEGKDLMAASREKIIAALDIGSSKICCFIARVGEDGRPHVIGIGHQVSQGIKAGTVVDMEETETSIRAAVDTAERMAGGSPIENVYVNISAGQPESRHFAVDVDVAGHQISDVDIKRVLDGAKEHLRSEERFVVHSRPASYSIDGVSGVKDPRGMYGEKLGVDMHMATVAVSPLKNLQTCINRCHLNLAGVVLSPYASGLSSLVQDERELGSVCIDMGGGLTSVAAFKDDEFIYADTIPLGGNHVTSDIAQGLSTPLANAERLKTLFGNCFPRAMVRDQIDIVQTRRRRRRIYHDHSALHAYPDHRPADGGNPRNRPRPAGGFRPRQPGRPAHCHHRRCEPDERA